MVAKYRGHGSPCKRICWVRLKGVITNLFVIAVYMSHRARVQPAQDDTLATLYKLLKSVPKNDCVVLLGDLNEQLGQSQNLTGKWALGEASPNAHKMLDMMRLFGLTAINTRFQQKKGKSTATYLSCTEGSENGPLAGRSVRATYKGKHVFGKVRNQATINGKKRWTVWFEDASYRSLFTERQVRK
jgi:hypothetical protein